LSVQTKESFAEVFDQTPFPERAVTLGFGTIREARALLVLAFGKHKAEAVAHALEGPLSASNPAASI